MMLQYKVFKNSSLVCYLIETWKFSLSPPPPALPLQVDLAEIGWDTVVVNPTSGFNTKYCLGHCLFPLNTTRDSFHAVLQAISHMHRPEIPPPCCVPKTFGRLAIIMRTDENQLILKKIENLIVKECACG